MRKDQNTKLQVRARANMDVLISTGQLSPSVANFDLEQIQKDIKTTLLDNTLENVKRKKGAQSIYCDDLLPFIEQMGANGCNNKQIAKALGIAYETLYDWFERYPHILLTLKKYRGIALIEVENAMFKSAIGYQYTEVKKERKKVGKDPTGKAIYEMVTTEATRKEVAPNLGAQVYITKNLMSHKYQDKVEQVHSLGAGIESMAFAIKRREE